MRLLILLFLLITATGCGKTGDLYIPDDNAAQAETRSG
jgi:predicted small lipoprotein YifL